MTDRLVVEGLEGLRAIVGRTLGPSAPLRIDQADVQRFADVTQDHQWIHLDVERARTETPFGGTIAHGYLVLSLLPPLLFGRLLDMRGVGSILNYGAERLRFPDVARVGSEISLRATCKELAPKAGGELGTFALEISATGSTRPCCVLDLLLLFLPPRPA